MTLLNKIKSWYFYNIQLFIGRPEKCYKCNKLIWNRTMGLYESLYWERNNPNMEKRRSCYCKKCVRRN